MRLFELALGASLVVLACPALAQTAPPGAAGVPDHDPRPNPTGTTVTAPAEQAPIGAAASAATNPPTPAADPNADPQIVDFASDTLAYDQTNDIVTATGNVILTRNDYRMRAREVVWDRKTGIVEARGEVIVIDPGGNQSFGDHMRLTDTLKDGVIDNILVVLQDGGRLAAIKGTRTAGVDRLDRAVYSPCEIDDSGGCPKTPLWEIKAIRVIHDPDKKRVFYKDAWLEMFGVPVAYLPAFSHPDGKGGNAGGVLTPEFRLNHVFGLEVQIPYYVKLSPTSDLTATPWLFTNANPAMSLDYRKLTSQGPIEVGGTATYTNRFPTDGVSTGEDFRGYAFAHGQLQHDSHWRSTFGLRLATDDTFLRRYYISYDDVLRNFYTLERFGVNSYLSVQGWAFQGLRVGDDGGTSPVALPDINYRWTPRDPILGGQVTVHGNLLAITRTDGEDVQRGIAEARWDLTRYTNWGQAVTATAMLRGDSYRVEDAAKATDAIYAGTDGWHGRAIPVAALNVEWPFAGPAFGGIQTITPRVQLVASPAHVANNNIPNEDARAIDLDDIDLFSLNRFPGFDRWEGGARVTYGGKWNLERPNMRASFEVGQSYRLDDKTDIFPVGTGLSGNFSDVVGRASLRIGNFVDLTDRFRLDKNDGQIRRNEVDLTVGSTRTYATVGYVRLNRDIQIEDLEDREELRAGARVQLTRYWSIIASAIVDLTSKDEDPLSLADGFEPVRNRVGIAYEDECFQLEFSWRRDYTQDRDFRQGNTYTLKIAFKNLGK